ncbi:Bacterial extracellular solute-binding protein, family 3 [Synechococcus sp. PCC 7335]|uniref:substrate-binding periplasmic protein n=1 Tax=Synechococcus sp. (strain ATCC 29403 / PCC 7335) TaxID=91464 RepID=UPI00017EDCDB|nr:ABC transporter substrate-binding protein [Synechococcus sp. PCC 7335]EDX84167.1 Bacterial extracellular solute-binding protein, family 3 [Synechococcus sp. PCC 7335]
MKSTETLSENLEFSADQQTLTKQAGYLNIVASDFDARPMSYINEEGYRTGYEPELARIVCDRLNLIPVWHNLPMEDFYTSLELATNCEYDVVWFNQAITPERQKAVSFTQPYGLFDEAVLVRQTSTVASPDQLADQCVGGLADSTNIALVEGFPGAQAVPYPGSDQVLPEMLAALRAGEIDALIDDELVLIVAAEEDTSLRLAFTLPTKAPFAIGVSKTQPLLLSQLEQTLLELINDGTLAELWATWIPWKPFPFS